jgi:hypothetical protein
MVVVLEVVGAILVLVGALVALDWFTSGRTKGRMLVRAKDQSSGNTGVGYAAVERNVRGPEQGGGQTNI